MLKGNQIISLGNIYEKVLKYSIQNIYNIPVFYYYLLEVYQFWHLSQQYCTTTKKLQAMKYEIKIFTIFTIKSLRRKNKEL